MATFGHISGAEPSTVTFKAATIVQVRNSSNMHQEIISLGDPDSSLALGAVLNSDPASTTYGLAVREVKAQSTTVNVSSVAGTVTIAGNSTVVQGTSPWVVGPAAGSTFVTRPIQSSAADLQATVTPASTVWAVQLSQYSTTAAISSVSGRVATMPLSTAWASSAGFHFNSSGELLTVGGGSAGGSTQVAVSSVAGTVAVTQASTVWQVQVSSIAGTVNVNGAVAVLQSTSAWNVSSVAGLVKVLAVDSSGTALPTVHPLNSVSTTVNSSASTALYSLVAASADLQNRAFAYTLTSTAASPITVKFGSSATDVWAVQIGSGSSGVSGANLAIAPPAYLFASSTNKPLTLNLSSTGVTVTVGVSYLQAVD